MLDARTEQEFPGRVHPGTRQSPLRRSVDRRFWQYWFLLVGIATIAVLGLATTIPTLANVIPSPWPWARTDQVLLAGVSALIIMFTVYLTVQQRKIVAIRAQLARAEERARESSSLHYSRLMALFSVSYIMGSEDDPQKVFDCITEMCKQIFVCDQASIMLVDPKNGDLTVRSTYGHTNKNVILGERMKIGEGISGWVAANRRPIRLGNGTDVSKYPGLKFTPRSITSAMVVPLIVRDEVVGVLNVSSRTSDVEYDMDDLSALMVFAEHTETFIRYTEKTTWLRDTIRHLQKLAYRKEEMEPGENEPIESPSTEEVVEAGSRGGLGNP